MFRPFRKGIGLSLAGPSCEARGGFGLLDKREGLFPTRKIITIHIAFCTFLLERTWLASIAFVGEMVGPWQATPLPFHRFEYDRLSLPHRGAA